MIVNKKAWILIPIVGAIFFLINYFIATLFYPGGSQLNTNSIGFSWMNNYWCNLLNDTSINGEVNNAKPIAMLAMVSLCFSLSYFWVIFFNKIIINKIMKQVYQISGIISMLIAFLLFTNFNHDLIIYSASFFACVAIIGTFIGLLKNKWIWLFNFGIINAILVLLNNVFYFSKGLILYLPILQKITFASFIIWICLINYKLYKTELK